MTDTVLHDALSLITRVDADTRRVWTDTPWLIGTANLGLAIASASGVCPAARLRASHAAQSPDPGRGPAAAWRSGVTSTGSHP